MRGLQLGLGWLLAAPLLLAAVACRDGRPTVILVARGGNEAKVTVEVADTPEARSRGLMYRTELAPDQGMIFLFERDARQRFWMKNTPLSLDMIFIAADGRIVGIMADTVPFSLKPVGPDEPSRAVLEVRAGFARKHGIAAGDRVRYEDIRSAALP